MGCIIADRMRVSNFQQELSWCCFFCCSQWQILVELGEGLPKRSCLNTRDYTMMVLLFRQYEYQSYQTSADIYDKTYIYKHAMSIKSAFGRYTD